jgi:hypothetical protein
MTRPKWHIVDLDSFYCGESSWGIIKRHRSCLDIGTWANKEVWDTGSQEMLVADLKLSANTAWATIVARALCLALWGHKVGLDKGRLLSALRRDKWHILRYCGQTETQPVLLGSSPTSGRVCVLECLFALHPYSLSLVTFQSKLAVVSKLNRIVCWVSPL